ncbi:helix-turn-helix transcriptional regulator [Sporosarcina saromensis]|uniref:Helix-turn-helix transcriptional regulator n=1 Tax=Sporosarcina saromensis TaxID=359365 RepID=A0ABU4GFY6_9BACL|nr:helix-turn-helix transcriptional regulator [Sporosarcina saromensis]MDW0115208.1 helix-turn-helix transcriptional regulator [Sporosarcina saromensis]
MEVEQAFGKILRKIRMENSLSQEELAYICGLDRTYISLMERGKRKPTINTIFELAKGLDERPSDLISLTEELFNLNVD